MSPRCGVLLAGLALATRAAAGVPADPPASGTNALPTPQMIFSNLVERAALASAQDLKGQFAYVKLRATEELNDKGKVTDKQEKIIESRPVNGRPFTRVIAENGRPPGDKKRRAQEETERRLREADPPEPKPAAGAAPAKKAGVVTPELFARFNFATVGRESVNGRDAWVLIFEPRSRDLPVKKFVDRIINKIAGRVWVDVEDSEVAKADLHLVSHVELVGGIVATLKKFDLVFEQRRFDGGAWFNTRTEANLEGRELVLGRRIHYLETISDVRRVAPPAAEPPRISVGE